MLEDVAAEAVFCSVMLMGTDYRKVTVFISGKNSAMTDTGTPPNHFTQAVTELGEKSPVVTSQTIFNDRGVKILDKGVAVNAKLYERLMAHKLPVPLEDSVTSEQLVTGSFLRTQAEQAMRDVPFFARLGANTKIRNLLLDALEQLPLPDPIAFQLLLACKVRPALFLHSIHAALFSAWLTQAQSPTVSRFDVSMAAAAGLLHDIGMLHLDPVLLNNPQNTIGRDQRQQLYLHPLVATTLIERHHAYSRELIRAVREHHEFLDGSGYPSHLSGKAISPLGRILSLSELVTTMLATGSPAAELRLGVQLRMNPHRYDATLVAQVVHNLKSLPLARQTEGHPDADQPVMADPVRQLLAINAALSAWPVALAHCQTLSLPRREGMVAVQEQAIQLRHTLANAGVAPQQLVQLGGDSQDDFLQLELTLLAQEATWQLRTLARQTRRRWNLSPDTHYPNALKTWLDHADALETKL